MASMISSVNIAELYDFNLQTHREILCKLTRVNNINYNMYNYI